MIGLSVALRVATKKRVALCIKSLGLDLIYFGTDDQVNFSDDSKEFNYVVTLKNFFVIKVS